MPARSSHISLSTHVQSTKAPWTTLLVLKAGQRVESLVAAPQGYVVKVLEGGKCRTRGTLFLEFARVLDFPDYFGHNWDALEECLADFEWLPAKGYVLLLTDGEPNQPDSAGDQRPVPATRLEAARSEALQFALQRGSRSGRVALQFARDFAGRHRLQEKPARR